MFCVKTLFFWLTTVCLTTSSPPAQAADNKSETLQEITEVSRRIGQLTANRMLLRSVQGDLLNLRQLIETELKVQALSKTAERRLQQFLGHVKAVAIKQEKRQQENVKERQALDRRLLELIVRLELSK